MFFPQKQFFLGCISGASCHSSWGTQWRHRSPSFKAGLPRTATRGGTRGTRPRGWRREPANCGGRAPPAGDSVGIASLRTSPAGAGAACGGGGSVWWFPQPSRRGLPSRSPGAPAGPGVSAFLRGRCFGLTGSVPPRPLNVLFLSYLVYNVLDISGNSLHKMLRLNVAGPWLGYLCS